MTMTARQKRNNRAAVKGFWTEDKFKELKALIDEAMGLGWPGVDESIKFSRFGEFSTSAIADIFEGELRRWWFSGLSDTTHAAIHIDAHRGVCLNFGAKRKNGGQTWRGPTVAHVILKAMKAHAEAKA